MTAAPRVLSAALLAALFAMQGCRSAETTDETSGGDSANGAGAYDVDSELYWYQRGSDATKAIWSKYRYRPDSALLKSPDSDSPLDFWLSAQAFDLLLDSVGTFWRKDLAAEAVEAYFRDFAREFPNRGLHVYNDDLLCWALSCIRAARITNDKGYLLEARELYDRLWATQVDNALGGGMWWRGDVRNAKNACVNMPAVIVAVGLYDATRDLKYLLQARTLYQWICESLYDGDTGKVLDYVAADGRRVGCDFPCNSGMFVGASMRLFRATGRKAYLANAMAAADYMISSMGQRGVLRSCGQGDGGAFNGIAVRYLAELARRPGCDRYRDFVVSNARAAWTSRRLSDGVNGPDWTKTPQTGDRVDPQTAVSAGMLYFAASRAFR